MASKKQLKTTPAQLRAYEKYRKEKTTQFYVKFNNEKDADVIARLNSLQYVSKTEYLRRLIRKDIEENS